jgi:hypothetical protein
MKWPLVDAMTAPYDFRRKRIIDRVVDDLLTSFHRRAAAAHGGR